MGENATLEKIFEGVAFFCKWLHPGRIVFAARRVWCCKTFHFVSLDCGGRRARWYERFGPACSGSWDDCCNVQPAASGEFLAVDQFEVGTSRWAKFFKTAVVTGSGRGAQQEYDEANFHITSLCAGMPLPASK